jgi:pyruvate kinase
MIKTKIVATVGPACADAGTIDAMIESGVDVFRLNFSHGDTDQHKNFLQLLNSVSSRRLRLTAVMGDLCGPKIRTASVVPADLLLKAGDEIAIVSGTEKAGTRQFSTNYQYFVQDILVGQRVFIDDGQIELNVIGKDKERLLCRVVVGGHLSSQKGINLPDTEITIPSITDNDWRWVDWAIANDLDFLALSFVRTADEINQLKQHIREAGSSIKVVAKIEKPQALSHLEQIIQASDAVLVARGDLGVEMDVAEVPLIQKKITHLCRRFGKPVIVATQMLQSMINNPAATRAEVSDVANAIMDTTDAVMLSGETAIGKYPLQAVKTICRIAAVTEAYLEQQSWIRPKAATVEELAWTAAIARSVAQIADDIDVKLVVVWSQTGSSATLLSKARIDTPVVALSCDRKICRQMSLHYGVIPFCLPLPQNVTQFTKVVEKLVVDYGLAKPGDKLILVAGEPVVSEGTKNVVMAHIISAH